MTQTPNIALPLFSFRKASHLGVQQIEEKLHGFGTDLFCGLIVFVSAI